MLVNKSGTPFRRRTADRFATRPRGPREALFQRKPRPSRIRRERTDEFEDAREFSIFCDRHRSAAGGSSVTEEKPKTRIVYRYDSEEFQANQIIRSQRDHFQRLSDDEKEVENHVRNTMPDGERIRSTSLYTWARLPIAERGWRSWRQAHLYRLEIKVEDIVFEGDLDFFSDAKDAVARHANPAEAVTQYCAGKIKSDGALVEVLVRENRTSRFPASGSRTRLHALLSRATPSVVTQALNKRRCLKKYTTLRITLAQCRKLSDGSEVSRNKSAKRTFYKYTTFCNGPDEVKSPYFAELTLLSVVSAEAATLCSQRER